MSPIGFGGSWSFAGAALAPERTGGVPDENVVVSQRNGNVSKVAGSGLDEDLGTLAGRRLGVQARGPGHMA
jgi:hypothetical protein